MDFIKQLTRRSKKILISSLLASSFFAANSYGLVQQADNRWHFLINPYVWMVNMNGDLGILGRNVHISQDFSDILKNLSVAGMLWMSAYRNDFGLFFDGVFAILKDSEKVKGINISVRNTYQLYTAGLAYQIFHRQFGANNASGFAISPYLGARYTSNKIGLNLDALELSDNQDWTQPVLGLRLSYEINPHWFTQLVGDIGGTNSSTNYSTNAYFLLGYKEPFHWKHAALNLGYRYLHQVYETGSGLSEYKWNMDLFGPFVGFTLMF